MKRLYYLSSGHLSQVDIGVLPFLSKTYEVIYGVIIPAKDSNFDASELADYCTTYSIKFVPFFLKRRQRDIRVGMEFLNVLRSIKKFNPDILYTTSFDNPIISIMCLFMNKSRTIISLHDVQFHSSYPYSAFFRIGRKITIAHFKYFQVFSKNQEKYFRRMYPDKKVYTLSLIPCNFETGKRIAHQKRNYGHDHVRFLFFGNILAYKGLDLLIDAANKLSYKYANFELLIAGRCNDWDVLYKPLIKTNQIRTKIRYIANNEIADLFTNSHYLILPYRDATQSGPLMIAYNYNIPVIASNIEAFREVIQDGVTGYLYRRSNPNALLSTLERVITQDKKEYHSLRFQLKRYVGEHLSQSNIVKKYELMFDSF